MDEVHPTEAEWARFAEDLAACLSALEEDEFLILSYKRSNYYVQFAGQGRFGMRVEAASNTYIVPPEARLSIEDQAVMIRLGWQLPTELPPEETGLPPNPDGSPNYFLDVAYPLDFWQVAELAVATFRRVYHVAHPGMLQYKAFNGGDNSGIRFPTLRVQSAKD
jgi:hypothetical protein